MAESKAVAAVFGRERTVITGHINNIIKEAELKEKSVCASVAHTPGCFFRLRRRTSK